MRPIEETTVLITGATDGLGRGVARDLAARGANVLLHGRSREKLDELSAELGGAPTFQADLSSLDEVRKLAAEVEERTAGAPRPHQQRRHRRRRARRHDAAGEQGRP